MTRTNIPKAHHFVAQMHGERFTNSTGYFYVFNKRAGQILRQKPGGAFKKTHLHTKIDAAGRHDTSLETELSVLEGEANLVIEKLLVAVSSGQDPALSAEEKAVWDQYFYIQWKRVPDVHERIALLAGEPGALDELLEEIISDHPEAAAEIKRLRNDPKELQQLLKQATVDAIRFSPGEVLQVLAQRDLVVLNIRAEGQSLAIGSQPLVRFGGDLQASETELWLPISSKVMVGIGRFGNRQRLVQFEDVNGIERVNQGTAEQSTSFAAADRSLIVALARHIGVSIDDP